MPCYDPPWPANMPPTGQIKKYIETLDDIERYCKDVLGETPVGEGIIVAQGVLDVIHQHWKKP